MRFVQKQISGDSFEETFLNGLPEKTPEESFGLSFADVDKEATQ